MRPPKRPRSPLNLQFDVRYGNHTYSSALYSEKATVAPGFMVSRITTPACAPVTSPSFCTTVNERVYITTSSDKGANGGSQGAVGDRRAAICGANASGAGGLYPSAECGRSVL